MSSVFRLVFFCNVGVVGGCEAGVVGGWGSSSSPSSLSLPEDSKLSSLSESPGIYHNDPKFSDRLILANSADPDQTAPRGAV